MKKRVFKKTKKALATACLAAGLCTASWVGGGQAADAGTYEISGSITPTSSLSNVYLFYGINDSGTPNEIFSKSLGNIGANENYAFSEIFTEDYPDLEYAWERPFTIIGQYDEGNDGTIDSVSIGMTNVSEGQSWASLFNVDEWWGTYSYAEDQLFGWLESASTDDLEEFVETAVIGAYLSGTASSFGGCPDGEDGTDLTMYNFSDATAAGVATADMHYPSAVPVPGSLSLLSLGLLALVSLQRRAGIE